MTESENINFINRELMEKMCHPIAVALFDSSVEPMTKFDDHEIALLESALNNPKQPYYPTFHKKAAILYYGLIKNHPFKNGNKRTATASLLIFLFINNLWLRGPQEEIEDYLVNLARRVAESKGADNKDLFLLEIEEWLSKYIQTLNDTING
ncbi:MAG: type II toxin-antitoxin system death-on-curing family toxin [Candidatus Wolfebacteria bacterium]|nr:type II toxin-antitoxin system death-on-curing family toxin [Candidatus Wolfebacteria bacterium]